MMSIFSFFQYQFKADLLHPDKEVENRKHKLKRLVQSPNSFFMDVKCKSCQKVFVILLFEIDLLSITYSIR